MAAGLIRLQPAGVRPTFPHGAAGDPTNMSAAAAANAAAVVSLAADTTRGIIISEVHFSYSAAPTGGRLQIGDAGPNLYFDADITAGGYQKVALQPPIVLAKGQTANVTLAAGGAAVTGKISLVNAFRLV